MEAIVIPLGNELSKDLIFQKSCDVFVEVNEK